MADSYRRQRVLKALQKLPAELPGGGKSLMDFQNPAQLLQVRRARLAPKKRRLRPLHLHRTPGGRRDPGRASQHTMGRTKALFISCVNCPLRTTFDWVILWFAIAPPKPNRKPVSIPVWFQQYFDWCCTPSTAILLGRALHFPRRRRRTLCIAARLPRVVPP